MPSQSGQADNFDGSLGGAVFHGSAQTWVDAAGAMNTLTAAYAGAFAAVAAAPSAIGIAARGIGCGYGLTGSGVGVVLGRNPEYLDAARAIGARALDTPERIYDFFNNAGEWVALNQSFLNASAFRGQQFFLSNPPLGQGGSGFEMELEYLTSRGIGPEQWEYAPLPYLGY